MWWSLSGLSVHCLSVQYRLILSPVTIGNWDPFHTLCWRSFQFNIFLQYLKFSSHPAYDTMGRCYFYAGSDGLDSVHQPILLSFWPYRVTRKLILIPVGCSAATNKPMRVTYKRMNKTSLACNWKVTKWNDCETVLPNYLTHELGSTNHFPNLSTLTYTLTDNIIPGRWTLIKFVLHALKMLPEP